ncbi:AAA family ATPase [Thermomonospora cellulosilytica]|uniref:Tetratricopeptide (TPR) repeat protein n=1 Tax=Thermomonospora cellulosilytica TaxID=1411118 RepID=A0A7W3MTE4_9ACTN|nr:AAA family ATPase [Thermomonospora cellulosilytica]MBA9001553.1 tetratricopeptide (TPR) repeat protein [Thermomonospora cellulosilytica]
MIDTDTDSLVLMTETGPAIVQAGSIEQIEAARTPAQAPESPPAARPVPPPAPAAPSPAWDRLREEFAVDLEQVETTAPVFGLDPAIRLSYTAAKEVEKHLNRVKNRLEASNTLREPARARQAIRDLVAAADECGYAPAYHLAALLLLEHGDTAAVRRQAAEWMTWAAPYGGRYAWDLAVLHLRGGEVEKAAATLGEGLRTTPAEQTDDRLLCAFLALVLRSGDTRLPVPVLAAAHAGAVQRTVAVRAGLYLVAELARERMPALEPLLSLTTARWDDLAQVLDALEPGAAERHRPAATSSAPAQPAAAAPHPGAPAAVPQARPAPAAAPPGPAAETISPGDPRLHVLAARNKLNLGRFDDALKIAQRALADHPGHPELLEIVEVARREKAPAGGSSPAPRRPVKAPAGQNRASLYAQAQRAETQEKDLDKAEELYRQTIARGGDIERAVRSLAWLLHRRKRSEEALELLRDPNVEVKETLQHRNMIITIVGSLGRWEEAAALLEQMLEEDHSRQVRTGLLKRLIVAYRKLRDARSARNAAERLLRHGPRNPEFRDIWAELEKAERTGIWDNIDKLLAKTDWSPEQPGSISPVLLLHLDRCEYAGVNPLRVQEGTLSEKDVQELEALIRKLGARRSADRAAYNLSVARILRDLNQTDDDLFRRSLRAFGAAMGDLCAAERRHGDVTRTYYTQAVALGPWDEMGELKVKQFVLSYLDPNWQQPQDKPPFEKCLEWVLEIESLRRPLLFGLLNLASESDPVRKELVSRTFRVAEIRNLLFDELCGYLGRPNPACTQDVYVAFWQEALHRLRQELDEQRKSLQLPLNRSDPLGTLAEDQQQLEQARQLAPTTQLDIDRLKAVATILGEVRGYLEQTSYLEQERLESKIRTAVRQLVTEIEGYPTRLSLEYLVPLLAKLDAAITAHFGEVQRAAEPSGLEVTEVLPSYVPDASSAIQVQLSVKNPPRRSPAVDVMLRVLDNSDDYRPVPEPIQVAHSLRDEQSESCTVPLVVTPHAIAERLVTLRYRLEFTVRSDERIVTEPDTLSLRLDDLQDWKPIPNPYSEGAPVKDENMFYGRGELLQTLVDALERPDAKCVVIYGQKRVGKSSVLHHLRRALKPPVLAAELNLGKLATNLDHARLLYMIAGAFFRKLEDLEEEGWPALDLPRPALRDFRDSGDAQIFFDDYMHGMLRQMRRSQDYRNWRLVLLLDEFTVLYSVIERGDLPREFMKAWKAMLESELFSSVVAGNDLMPRFLKAFPNEFQVARQEPVSYLDPGPAEELITVPVRLDNGENRHRGDSVQRILELTARSPYYIQLFCNRLIQHMNAERQMLIGPADVDRVATALVSGDQALPLEQFDNLLTPGDADVSDLPAGTVLEVLNVCLTGRRRDLHLDGRKARDLPDGPRVLEDLMRRNVIVREAEDRYRIKVGLFAEWLWHRKA